MKAKKATSKPLGDFEQKSTGVALIVHPVFPLPAKSDRFVPAVEDQIEEATGLAHAIFLDVLDVVTVTINKPAPGYLIGKGNREKIGAMVEAEKPDLVIVNHNLSPVQQRNLERAWSVKVIDRTGLILEIFGERAQTKEGKIQVELAALEYQKSRLIRSWTHLERQRGGAGFMGGPGETQLEIDRRIIVDRIARLKKDLDHVRRNRELQKRSRAQVPFPIVALVGYTNAGKSTLFNVLTGAQVFAEDLPFATLDPTMRKLALPQGEEVILADTVGFIADLPTHLVAAFRSTLEQVSYADIILHVRDISRPDHDMQKREVALILNDLGVDTDSDPRVIEVWNKIDALAGEDKDIVLSQARRQEHDVVLVSALQGEGVDSLCDMIQARLNRHKAVYRVIIPHHDGKALSWIHAKAQVINVDSDDMRQSALVLMDPALAGRFRQAFPACECHAEEDDDYHYAGKGG